MAIIIMSHPVKDYVAWKPIYDGDSPRRTSAGLKELAVGTQAGQDNIVYMIWEGDPAAAEQMMKDPNLPKLMEKAGVLSPPEMIVINT